jgi:hypothetical protein
MNAQRPKTIILILSLLLIVSCKEVKEFPEVPLFTRDPQNQVCREWEIYDREKLLFKLTQVHTIEKCDELFGFHRADFTKVKNWSRDSLKKDLSGYSFNDVYTLEDVINYNE